MVQIRGDDIRVLGQTEGDALLILANGRVRVVTDGEKAPRGRVIYRKCDLLAELGEEITDSEADTLAAGLTAELGGATRPQPGGPPIWRSD
jgi:hypothetical protein